MKDNKMSRDEKRTFLIYTATILVFGAIFGSVTTATIYQNTMKEKIKEGVDHINNVIDESAKKIDVLNKEMDDFKKRTNKLDSLIK